MVGQVARGSSRVGSVECMLVGMAVKDGAMITQGRQQKAQRHSCEWSW